MAPIRSHSDWKTRASNKEKQIEPFKHYYFICEGQNTERWYFEKFIDMKKEFSISALVSIEYLEKTEEHKRWSDPKKLYDLAEISRKNGDISFDPKYDTMILVFDADIYESREPSSYNEFIEKASKTNTICVTNPSFELFLLLHYENSYSEIILPNASAIIKNDWIELGDERIRYVEQLFRVKSGLHPKKDPAISKLVKNIYTAIDQEKNLNNDILFCRGNLTSNIGIVMQKILDEKIDE